MGPVAPIRWLINSIGLSHMERVCLCVREKVGKNERVCGREVGERERKRKLERVLRLGEREGGESERESFRWRLPK